LRCYGVEFNRAIVWHSGLPEPHRHSVQQFITRLHHASWADSVSFDSPALSAVLRQLPRSIEEEGQASENLICFDVKQES